jgi:hypothetical protein
VIALATLASALGRVVSRAVGGGPIATDVCTLILPAITAFVTVPAPRSIHRVRRVALVLAFTGVVVGCRKALAKIWVAARLPGAKPRYIRGEVSGVSVQTGVSAGNIPVSAAAAHLTHAWLGHVALTAAIAMTPAAAALTAHAALGGQALSASGPTVRVPGDMLRRVLGNQTATRVTYHVTATDGAGNRLAPKCDPPSGARFALGKTPVACSATDAAGKQAHASFLVTVHRGGKPQPPDDTKPKLDVPDDFAHDATTPSGSRVTYPASAHDDRDGALTPDCLPISGSFFALGPTRVRCTATDAAGNTSDDDFTITVVPAGDADHTGPVISVPDPIKRAATSKEGAKVTYTVSATDNRDGPLKPSCDPASGSLFPVDTTTVTCSAHDHAGNSKTQSFTVTVTPWASQSDGPTPGSPRRENTDPPPPSPLSTPLDLTGNWHLKFMRAPDYQVDEYTIALSSRDDAKCQGEKPPCYGGYWYHVNRGCVAAEFIARAEATDHIATFSGTARDYPDRGRQIYTGHSTIDSSTPLAFTGTFSQQMPPGQDDIKANFVFTRCTEPGQTTAPRCPVYPACPR